MTRFLLSLFLSAGLLFSSLAEEEKLNVLLLSGRNNHDWKRTSEKLVATLEASSRFSVTVSNAPEAYPESRPRITGKESEAEAAKISKALKEWEAANRTHEDSLADEWAAWRPDFASADVVVNNYNGPDWPTEVKTAFVDYVRGGGGLVNVHAANNAFHNWPEFNEMLGLAYRPAPFGKRFVVDDATGDLVELDQAKEKGTGEKAGHGSKHEFLVVNRQVEHPILRNLPVAWMHGRDELYHGQRGPSENLEILASAFSDPEKRGSGNHEPVLWTVDYGKGCVVTTSLGHLWRSDEDTFALDCIGFQTVLARSAEWAATGQTTLKVPDGFPYAHRVSLSTPEKTIWDGAAASVDREDKSKPRFPIRTPEESAALIELPPGYRAEVVAAEPDIIEPVWVAWDGNGAMYVAEMNSYMQDPHGTGTKENRNGRIKRLVDTDGDGFYETVTVFADELLLPRMILPLDGRVFIQETDDQSLWSLRDTTGDGVADEKKKVKDGGTPSNSVEHQDSALTWGLDNWLITAQGRERIRYRGGEWISEKVFNEFNQWGMGMDDMGNTYYSQNSIPGRSFQQPWIYWNLIGEAVGWKKFERPSLGPDTDAAFQSIYPIFPVGDRQEPMNRSWTSACGLSIYRGDALPEMVGDMMLCEPCSHTVRRAKVTKDEDGTTLANRDGRAEFFASRDFYSRPVATATGPDGALYIVDMYRGMIQDSPWVGPEFVERIEEMGAERAIRHGRIYRIVHEDHEPETLPKLLDLEPTELVPHLAHPNGWRRDSAQMLLVMRGDKSIVPALEKFASECDAPIGRVHALWTLEGLDAISRETASAALDDSDPRVRQTALRLHEPWLKDDFAETFATITKLADDSDPFVLRQLILSLGWNLQPQAISLIEQIAEANVADGPIFLATMTGLHGKTDLPLVTKAKDGSLFRAIEDPKTRIETQSRWKAGLATWEGKPARPRSLDPEVLELVAQGTQIYEAVCHACHGADGKGVTPPGLPSLAPSLVGSPRVLGPKEALVRILQHGLTGPVDGRSYQAGIMAPLGVGQPDEWVAAVLTYIRKEWVNNASAIFPGDVAEIREASAEQSSPGTQEELAAFSAPLLEDRSGWTASASSHTPANLIDGKRGTGHDQAWQVPNKPGSWFAVDLGKSHRLTHIVMHNANPEYFSRGYSVRISDDGKTWSDPVATGKGSGTSTMASFEPVETQHIKVEATGQALKRWMVSEIDVFGE